MRFTITPLGSAGGRTIGQVVDDIVRYLEPRDIEAAGVAPVVAGGPGPSSYYADRGTEPGRWLGVGAREAGLRGAVVPSDFASVLAGRDPASGTRLITAQGSAGRRPRLGVGAPTRAAPDGTALYDTRDAAAVLGVSEAEASRMVAVGERLALGQLVGQDAPDEPAGSYLVPTVDGDGSRWVTAAELGRCEEARSRGVEPSEVAGAGEPHDQLTLIDAARLAGVTARYLRGLCRRWESQRDTIESAVADGRPPARAWLVGYRGTRGQWLVKRADLVAFLERRVPPAVRVGYDLTATTEKSIGVLALLGSDHVRRTVLEAIQQGNDAGLAHLEQHAATARSRGQRVGIRGWTVASFRHLTSRALDPFPHHHNVVANTIVDEDGVRRALDARGLYLQAQAASALATAEMRYRLTRDLGVTWRESHAGGWEVEGIPDDVCRAFSRRRAEIEEAVAELEEAIGRAATLDEVQGIVTATRPPKEEVDASALVAGWWERARLLDFTPDLLAAATGQANPIEPPDVAVVFAALVNPDHGLCAGSSIFTRSDVLAAMVDLTIERQAKPQPLLVCAAELDRLADDFLASSLVVELLPVRRPKGQLAHEALFTTPAAVDTQRRILDRYEHGLTAGGLAVPEDVVTHALAAHEHLTSEQTSLVRSFCTSSDAIQCAIGRAGAGKTTAMRAVAEAWTAVGWRVVGAAVKGEATRHLANGAGIAAETVAWYLAHTDPARLPLDARTVLIIDEATTLSDRDLDNLLAMATEAGAVVRLLGDPAQHGAVGAGGMFRYLCEHNPERTPTLEATHRLQHPSDVAAARALRDGDIEDALRLLDSAGHLHVVDSDVELYLAMLQRWWHGHLNGQHHPMVDRRNRTRRQLNRLARQLLKVNGELGDREIAASGDRAFAVGDRVIARRVARDLHPPQQPKDYLRNGAVGTVVGLQEGREPHDDKIDVAFEGIGTITVPRSFFDERRHHNGRRDVGLDHAYAVTSYAVQGATFDTSTSRIDEHASRAETYVDITRGRTANHLFLTRADDALDGEHLPRVPPPPTTETVTHRLTQSGPEHTAVDIDAGLIEPLDPARTAEQERRRVMRAARHADAPIDLAAFAPPPSAPVHLERLWRRAVASVSGYRQTWPLPAGSGPWAWLVGVPPSDPAARRARDRACHALGAFVRAQAREVLASGDAARMPPWKAEAVELVAARGCWPHDWSDLQQTLAQVEAYRASRGMEPSDLPGEGISRILGSSRAGGEDAVRAVLAKRLMTSGPPGQSRSVVR